MGYLARGNGSTLIDYKTWGGLHGQTYPPVTQHKSDAEGWYSMSGGLMTGYGGEAVEGLVGGDAALLAKPITPVRLERAVELDPKNVTARLYLAQTLLEMSEYDKALQEFRAVHEIDPASAEALVAACTAAGLEVATVWGDYDGSRHDTERSPRTIVRALRRA